MLVCNHKAPVLRDYVDVQPQSTWSTGLCWCATTEHLVYGIMLMCNHRAPGLRGYVDVQPQSTWSTGLCWCATTEHLVYGIMMMCNHIAPVLRGYVDVQPHSNWSTGLCWCSTTEHLVYGIMMMCNHRAPGLRGYVDMHSTTMEPCVVWEFPFPPIEDPDCRDVIIEKPCIVGAQPTGNYANYIASRSPRGFPDSIVIFCFRNWKCILQITSWAYTTTV